MDAKHTVRYKKDAVTGAEWYWVYTALQVDDDEYWANQNVYQQLYLAPGEDAHIVAIKKGKNRVNG